LDKNLKSIIVSIATANPTVDIKHIKLPSAVTLKRKQSLRGRRSCN